MKITGNEPATGMIDPFSHATYRGLTIRQQFAMAAMQGMISNAPNGHLSNSKEGVQLSVQWADALIEELNKDKFSTKCNP